MTKRMTIILTISDQNWSNRSSADPDDGCRPGSLGVKKRFTRRLVKQHLVKQLLVKKTFVQQVLFKQLFGQTDLAKELQCKHLLFQRPLFE